MLSHERLAMFPFLAIVLVPVVGSAADDETYNLRGAPPEKGQVYILTAKSSGKDLVRKFKGDEKSFEQKFSETGSTKKEMEVLAVAGGEIIAACGRRSSKTSASRAFARAEKRSRKPGTATWPGKSSTASESRPAGRIHWKTSSRTISKKRAARKILSRSGEDDCLLPAEKVKVGHTWKIEQAVSRQDFR